MIELIIKGNADADRIVDYLSQRIEIDECLREAVNKPNKTIEGVMKYVKDMALETIAKADRHGTVVRMIDDEDVYEWAVHYILEDSIDCEPKAEQKKAEDYIAKWKEEHKVVEPPKIKVGDNPQLLFDF